MSTYHIPYESVPLIMNPKIPAEIINAIQPFPFAYQQKNAKTGDSKVNKLHIMAQLFGKKPDTKLEYK